MRLELTFFASSDYGTSIARLPGGKASSRCFGRGASSAIVVGLNDHSSSWFCESYRSFLPFDGGNHILIVEIASLFVP